MFTATRQTARLKAPTLKARRSIRAKSFRFSCRHTKTARAARPIPSGISGFTAAVPSAAEPMLLSP